MDFSFHCFFMEEKLTNNRNYSRLSESFFTRDVLEVAPELLGKYLVLFSEGKLSEYLITELEIYRGEEDLACHARNGRTKRNEIMYETGGKLYVYLIYGMYWMLNIVTGKKNQPQAILIRGVKGYNGPGKLTKALGINKSFNKEDLLNSTRIWVKDNHQSFKFVTTPRIGIDYAGDYWRDINWRLIISE